MNLPKILRMDKGKDEARLQSGLEGPYFTTKGSKQIHKQAHSKAKNPYTKKKASVSYQNNWASLFANTNSFKIHIIRSQPTTKKPSPRADRRSPEQKSKKMATKASEGNGLLTVQKLLSRQPKPGSHSPVKRVTKSTLC